MTRDDHGPVGPLPVGRVGWLELRVLEAFWARLEPGTVRDISSLFPDSAYTTLMTTADRLHLKGLLSRVKRGRAFLYRPAITKAAWIARQCEEHVRWALGHARSREDAVLLMSMLTDAFAAHDLELLEALEALIAEARANNPRQSA